MNLPTNVTELLLQAEGKALATKMPDDVHVVPVSTVYVEGDEIWLVNYFMGQTLKNIETEDRVSLACWRGLEGYQIKSTVRYQTEGEVFEEVCKRVAVTLPERGVNGVLILTPYELYNVSATADRPGEKIL